MIRSITRRKPEDEIEHLHVGYLISIGELPYRDFFEHHLPMFHYLISVLNEISIFISL